MSVTRGALLVIMLLALVVWGVAWTYRRPVVDGQSVAPSPVVGEYHGPGCAWWHASVRVGEAWGGEVLGLMAPWL